MKNLRSEIIKYSKMLNSKNLSALRSGNISSRYKDGFLITPSGKKYSALKSNDIVFVSLNGYFDKKKGIPSSEWKFHQDIYKNKKDAKAIVHEQLPLHLFCFCRYLDETSTQMREFPFFYQSIHLGKQKQYHYSLMLSIFFLTE